MTMMMKCDKCPNQIPYDWEKDNFLEVSFQRRRQKTVTKHYCPECAETVLSVMGIHMEDACDPVLCDCCKGDCE